MNCKLAKVLALSPHTDDVELGAGGTLAKWVEEGTEVSFVALSICDKSVCGDMPKDIMEREVHQACKVLGIAEKNLYIYKFEVRTFPTFRQEILELLVSLRQQLEPDLVLLPSLRDMHQDHHTIAEEGIRAFKHTSILGYEEPWNQLSFAPSLFVALERQHLEKKVGAINCYGSQRHKNYANEEFLYGLARTRGIQLNCDYAEAFEVVRWVIK